MRAEYRGHRSGSSIVTEVSLLISSASADKVRHGPQEKKLYLHKTATRELSIVSFLVFMRIVTKTADRLMPSRISRAVENGFAGLSLFCTISHVKKKYRR